MIDIIPFCSEARLPILQSGHHHCKEGWVQLHCPFCTGGRGGWHLGFSLESGVFNCWRCGRLEFWDVLMGLLHTRDRRAVSELVRKHQTNKALVVRRPPVTRRRTIKPPPACMPMWDDGARPHREYLTGRGFDPLTLAAEYDLKATGPHSPLWAWRIVFPLHNAAGEVVAYLGRSIGDVRAKYKFTKDEDCLEDPKEIVYGLHMATGDSVVIVEGPTGVWRIGAGAVATLGINWRVGQANKLRHYKNRYVLYDPEPKAQKRAEELAAHLSQFPGTTEVVSGFSTDPGELRPDEVHEIRSQLLT